MRQTMGLTRGLVATYRRQRLLEALLDEETDDPDEEASSADPTER